MNTNKAQLTNIPITNINISTAQSHQPPPTTFDRVCYLLGLHLRKSVGTISKNNESELEVFDFSFLRHVFLFWNLEPARTLFFTAVGRFIVRTTVNSPTQNETSFIPHYPKNAVYYSPTNQTMNRSSIQLWCNIQ